MNKKIPNQRKEQNEARKRVNLDLIPDKEKTYKDYLQKAIQTENVYRVKEFMNIAKLSTVDIENNKVVE